MSDLAGLVDEFLRGATVGITLLDSLLGGEEPPSPLFHYTDGDGLMGIVRDRCLWATHAAFLNDPRETLVVREALRAILDESTGSPFMSELRDLCRPAAEPDLLQAPAYVVAFTETGNDLSQWRSYGDGGRGYALGFDTEGLRVRHCRLMRVRYGMGDAVATIRRFLELLGAAAARDGAHDGGTRVRASMGLFLTLAAPMFKSEEYRSEREWRLVLKSDADARPFVRSRRGELVPTRCVDLGKTLPLLAVNCGPATHPRRAKVGVETCLNAQRINVAPVVDGVRVSHVGLYYTDRC